MRADHNVPRLVQRDVFIFRGGCLSLDVTAMMLRKRNFKNARTARNVRTSADAARRYAAAQVRIEYTAKPDCSDAVVEKRQSHNFSSSGMYNKN